MLFRVCLFYVDFCRFIVFYIIWIVVCVCLLGFIVRFFFALRCLTYAVLCF